MHPALELWEHVSADEIYMLAGWRQWADGGSVSSELPQYLIAKMGARQIGKLKSDSFYFFQLPGTQQFLRPEIKLEDGVRKELRHQGSDIWYWGNEHKGLVIFIGDEPHMNAEQYAEAFFSIAQELKVKRIIGVGGVLGPVPFDQDRQITCTYSLPRMRDELENYAVSFSNYEGGVSIGSYLLDQAEKLGIEYCVFYALVPMYDVSQIAAALNPIMIEHDYQAWRDVMRCVNHMFQLDFDLLDLDEKSRELGDAMQAQIDELDEKMPQLKIKEQLEKLGQDFQETPFLPLDDVWRHGLEDIFNDDKGDQ